MIRHLGSAIDLFVHPGEHEFADENFCVRTTLGSCVAVVLWHPQRKLGGMCHYMLPERGVRGRAADQPLNGKYAEEALQLLFNEAKSAGTDPAEYEVKLFGGGNMFPGGFSTTSGVAARNVAAARRLAEVYRLRVKAESVGGVGYRNVVFDIARGDVWVRHVAKDDPRIRSRGLL